MPLTYGDNGEVVLDPRYPKAAQADEESLARWQMCIAVAQQFTDLPEDNSETRMFATTLFNSPMPTHAPELQEAHDAEFERLHPRGRGKRFIRKPKVIAPPQARPSSSRTTLEQITALGLDKPPEPSELARSMMGGHDHSSDFHTKGEDLRDPTVDHNSHAPYRSRRRRLHDRIVGRELAKPIGELLGGDHNITQKLRRGERLDSHEKELVRQAAHASRQGTPPEALFLAGGPASGKTTLLRNNPELRPQFSVSVDPDKHKESLPEFQKLRAARDHYAAQAVHIESGDIAARLADEAAQLGLNVVIDGTGNSERGRFVDHLKRKKASGYDVSAIYSTTTTDEAVRRAVDRAEETGRFVPVPVVRDQHAKVSRNFADVAKLDWLSGLDVYDDTSHIGEMDGAGNFHDLDPVAMKEFRDKEKERKLDD